MSRHGLADTGLTGEPTGRTLLVAFLAGLATTVGFLSTDPFSPLALVERPTALVLAAIGSVVTFTCVVAQLRSITGWQAGLAAAFIGVAVLGYGKIGDGGMAGVPAPAEEREDDERERRHRFAPTIGAVGAEGIARA